MAELDKFPDIMTMDRNMTDAEAAKIRDPNGMIEITSVEQIMELSRLANEAHDFFLAKFRNGMSDDMARTVKMLRLGGLSWREVALKMHDIMHLFGSREWLQPPSNQLAGMAACQAAREKLGETEGDWK